jgi:hypothetical protein
LTLPLRGSGLGGGEIADRLADVSPLTVRKQVDEFLSTRLSVLQHVRNAMSESQDKQKEHTDAKSRGNVESYEVGDLVLLNAKNLPTHAVSAVFKTKLRPRFVGPTEELDVEEEDDFDAALLPEDSWEPDNANGEDPGSTLGETDAYITTHPGIPRQVEGIPRSRVGPGPSAELRCIVVRVQSDRESQGSFPGYASRRRSSEAVPNGTCLNEPDRCYCEMMDLCILRDALLRGTWK